MLRSVVIRLLFLIFRYYHLLTHLLVCVDDDNYDNSDSEPELYWGSASDLQRMSHESPPLLGHTWSVQHQRNPTFPHANRLLMRAPAISCLDYCKHMSHHCLYAYTGFKRLHGSKLWHPPTEWSTQQHFSIWKCSSRSRTPTPEPRNGVWPRNTNIPSKENIQSKHTF